MITLNEIENRLRLAAEKKAEPLVADYRSRLYAIIKESGGNSSWNFGNHNGALHGVVVKTYNRAVEGDDTHTGGGRGFITHLTLNGAENGRLPSWATGFVESYKQNLEKKFFDESVATVLALSSEAIPCKQ